MLSPLALVSVLAGGSPPRMEISLAGSHEDLSRPDGVSWDDGEASLALRKDSWRVGGSVRGIERYDLADGEAGLLVARDSREFGWECGASHGFEERFLPTWALRTSAHAAIARSWNAELAQKTSLYPDLWSLQPEAAIELYAGSFLFGVRTNQPVADGTLLDPGGQLFVEYSWTDAGAARIAASRSSEAEASGDGGVLETRVTSFALSIRQRFAFGTTLRGGLSWTRQGTFHDRMGANLGLSHDFSL